MKVWGLIKVNIFRLMRSNLSFDIFVRSKRWFMTSSVVSINFKTFRSDLSHWLNSSKNKFDHDQLLIKATSDWWFDNFNKTETYFTVNLHIRFIFRRLWIIFKVWIMTLTDFRLVLVCSGEVYFLLYVCEDLVVFAKGNNVRARQFHTRNWLGSGLGHVCALYSRGGHHDREELDMIQVIAFTRRIIPGKI